MSGTALWGDLEHSYRLARRPVFLNGTNKGFQRLDDDGWRWMVFSVWRST